MTDWLAGETLVIATHNPGKLREFAELIESCGVKIASAAELGLPEPEETGATFAIRSWPTIPGSRSRRSAARRVSIRRAGPGRTRTLPPPWRGSNGN